MKAYAALAPLLSLLILLAGCEKESKPGSEADASHATPSSLQAVRFANLPYGDHTIAAIGVEKGFFKDAGIDLKMDTIKIEEVVPALINKKYDVVSVPPGILFSSYESAPDLTSFVFSDLFQGYAIMGQAGAGYKSYADFVNEGKTHEEAIQGVAVQLRGKTFTYPAETAVKPFIDQVLKAGGLTASDYRPLVLDDPLTVGAMRNKEADFQVGGVPSRLKLEKEGFIPLLSSVDLCRGAKASPDSPELAAILQNGWATTKTWQKNNPELALKMAGVNYRIMQFIKDHEDEAAEIHMRYLSKVTGQDFSRADAKIIYHSLDPFMTFEEQKPWFHEPQSPFYYANINGAILKSFITSGVYKNNPPMVDDVISAQTTYLKLEDMKKDVENKIEAFAGGNPPEAKKTVLDKARSYVADFDFIDAEKTLKENGASN